MQRALRRTIVPLVALATAIVVAGCGGTTPAVDVAAVDVAPSARPTPAPTPAAVAQDTLIMIIRHGEKPDDSTSGINASGNEDDSSMTATGWDRAHRLVDLFDPAAGDPRPGLARPKAIYAAGANDNGEGQRTRETVQPLADRLGILAVTTFGKGDEEKLIEHVLSQPGPTLISWQHGEIPAMAEAFPGATPTPPTEWPDDRYDVIWTLTKTVDGWQFAQLPELVLPQDQADPIEASPIED